MIRVKSNNQVNKQDWKKVEELNDFQSGNGFQDKIDEKGNVYRVYYPTWTTPKNVCFQGNYPHLLEEIKIEA